MPALPIPPGGDLVGVPIGTIVPYVGPLGSLPENWVPCDGRVINVAGSPLNGQPAPRLTDSRFFMSVPDENSVLSLGGTTQIPPGGAHNHLFSGSTDFDQATVLVKEKENNNTAVAKSPHTHNVKGFTESNGEHNHGGENRPPFIGVFFILRVA